MVSLKSVLLLTQRADCRGGGDGKCGASELPPHWALGL